MAKWSPSLEASRLDKAPGNMLELDSDMSRQIFYSFAVKKKIKKSTSGILFRAMEEPVSWDIRSDISPVWPQVGLSFLCIDSLLTKWIVCCCYAIHSNQAPFPMMSCPKFRSTRSWTGLEPLNMISNTHEDIFPHVSVTLSQQSQRITEEEWK